MVKLYSKLKMIWHLVLVNSIPKWYNVINWHLVNVKIKWYRDYWKSSLKGKNDGKEKNYFMESDIKLYVGDFPWKFRNSDLQCEEDKDQSAADYKKCKWSYRLDGNLIFGGLEVSKWVEQPEIGFGNKGKDHWNGDVFWENEQWQKNFKTFIRTQYCKKL